MKHLPECLILENKLAPGDALVSTAALHCLHEQYPNRYLTDMRCSCPDVFLNNPYITPLEDGRRITLEYPLIHQCNQRPVHFLQGYTDFLAETLGIPLTLTVNRPQIYLTKQEKETPLVNARYWVINPSWKKDYTVKKWSSCYWQEVINHFAGKIQFVQTGAIEHMTPKLAGVVNMVGQTTARELIRLIYHAEGVVTAVSFHHHIAAALQKPCVTIASGMEPISWETYPTCRMLSSHGALNCCRLKSCWKARIVKLHDGDKKDQNLCEQPYLVDGEPTAKCMAMISPERVIDAIEEMTQEYDFPD